MKPSRMPGRINISLLRRFLTSVANTVQNKTQQQSISMELHKLQIHAYDTSGALPKRHTFFVWYATPSTLPLAKQSAAACKCEGKSINAPDSVPGPRQCACYPAMVVARQGTPCTLPTLRILCYKASKEAASKCRAGAHPAASHAMARYCCAGALTTEMSRKRLTAEDLVA